jgi:SHS2 domain-containing protein
MLVSSPDGGITVTVLPPPPLRRHNRLVGFELLPHTADLKVTAWSSTMEGCLAEAARGLVASFADVGGTEPERAVTFTCEPGPDAELLVELLDEVIFVVETEDAVPARVSVARTGSGGLAGEFGVVRLDAVPAVGPAPKAVTRHGLSLGRSGQGTQTWRCEVVVDV